MNRPLIITSLILVSTILGQRQPETAYPFRAVDSSPRIAKLRSDVAKNGKAALGEFWNEMRKNGTPLVESLPGDDQHSLVTFVWQGSAEAKNVVITDGVSIGVGGTDPMSSEMIRINDTDVWYRTYDVRNDARFTYSLSENDPLALFTDPNRKSNSKADPLNPHKFATGQTYVELSAAPPQPWIAPQPPALSGKVEATSFKNASVWVYTPVSFQQTGVEYPLVVLMGGRVYMNFTSVPATLDHLIAEKRIPPVVAVAVNGTNDNPCSNEYADFLATELVPWLQSTYHATKSPAQIVISGSSLGALQSTCSAISHPDVFGKVLSQSGAYWWKRTFGSRSMPDDVTDVEWLKRQIASRPKVPVQFFLEVGLMEASEVQLEPNRRMRDTLLAKGYAVKYQEFNGNHNYINWRGGFGDGIVALLGR
jgi:enterochelin esterase-like enzyme